MKTRVFFGVFALFFLALAVSPMAEGSVDSDALNDATEAYYAFDEGSGSTAFDSTDNNHDGTLNGNVDWTVNGKIGNALNFPEGSEDYVSTSFTPTVESFSVGGWIKVDNEGRNGIFSTVEDAGTRNGFYFAADDGNRLIAPFYKDDSFIGESSNFSIDVGSLVDEWHFVVLSYYHDGSNSFVEMYLDGTLVQSYDLSSQLTSFQEPLWIGSEQQDFSDRRFGGDMDEVFFFNRALSSEEIEFLYAEGSPGEEQQYPYGDSATVVSGVAERKSMTGATIHGTIKDMIEDVEYNLSFEYREIGDEEWSTTGLIDIVDQPKNYSYRLNNLESNTTYEYRALSESSTGETIPGDTRNFTTNTRLQGSVEDRFSGDGIEDVDISSPSPRADTWENQSLGQWDNVTTYSYSSLVGVVEYKTFLSQDWSSVGEYSMKASASSGLGGGGGFFSQDIYSTQITFDYNVTGSGTLLVREDGDTIFESEEVSEDSIERFNETINITPGSNIEFRPSAEAGWSVEIYVDNIRMKGDYTSNTTGIANTDYSRNESQIKDFFFEKNNYFNETVEQHNTTQPLSVQMHQAEVDFQAESIVTEETVEDFTVDIDGNIYQWNETAKLSADTHTATFQKTGWFDKHLNITTSPLEVGNRTFTEVYDTVASFQVENLTDNTHIDEFSGTVYTNNFSTDFSTENGTADIKLLQGEQYFVELDPVEGMATNFGMNHTFTPESDSHNHTFGLYTDNSISFEVREEETNEKVTEDVNVDITGDVFETDFVISDGDHYIDNVPDGSYNIRLTSSSYDRRVYHVSVENRSFQEVNAFLASDTEQVDFTVLDEDNQEPIEDARLTMHRFINGSWKSVEVASTDIVGIATFNFLPDRNYKFLVTADGYNDRQFNLDPISLPSYNVRLGKEVTIGVDRPLTDVFIFYQPKIYHRDIINFSAAFQSPEGKLSSYFLNLTHPYGEVAFEGSNSQGEMFEEQFNLSDASIGDEVVVEYGYTTAGGTSRSYRNIYSIDPRGDRSFVNAGEDLGVGIFTPTLTAVVLTLLFAGITSMVAGVMAGGAMGLFALGFFVTVGFIPLWAGLISMLVGIMYMLGGSDR